MRINRREALGRLAGAASALWMAAGGFTMPADDERTPAGTTGTGAPAPPAGKHVLKDLPFDPTKLRGLSERLIVSHHENNYGGALRNLNRVEEELARVTVDTPAFIVAGLRERELTFTNSVILHELYFGNLGGTGKPDGAAQKAIADAFGTFARWEELFRATGMSLAGGSGWAILDLNFHSRRLQTYWSGNHTQALSFGAPLLIMDMYEHAYQMDYGAAAGRYVDAFFENIHWEEVSRRLERAEKAASAMSA